MKTKLLWVQTASKALELPVPSPFVADVEEFMSLLDSSTAALFDDLKTVKNMSPPQTLPSLPGKPSDLIHSPAVQ